MGFNSGFKGLILESSIEMIYVVEYIKLDIFSFITYIKKYDSILLKFVTHKPWLSAIPQLKSCVNILYHVGALIWNLLILVVLVINKLGAKKAIILTELCCHYLLKINHWYYIGYRCVCKYNMPHSMLLMVQNFRPEYWSSSAVNLSYYM